MDNKNYTDYLSDSEKKALENVNKLGNNLSKKIENDKDIFNQNISQIIQNWSSVQVNIMNELISLYSNMDDYNNYNQWWEYILYYYKQTVNILLKEDRIIYTGFSIIFISLVLYFVDTSK